MPTIRDWIDHFKTLEQDTRSDIERAISTLDDDLWLHRHYGSDLSSLLYANDAATREVNR